MRTSFVVLACSLATAFAAPVADANAAAKQPPVEIESLKGLLNPVLGLIGLSQDKRSDSDGKTGGLGDVISNLAGYVPILGGNNGPLIPGLAGSKE